MVTENQRNLTLSSCEKFIVGLGLAGNMAAYFRVLVKMNQEKNDANKIQYYEELKKLTPITNKRNIDLDSVQYLSHWIYPVIREMVASGLFQNDPYRIARKLTGRISIAEINNAINFLLKANFIEIGEKGTFSVKEDIVLSSDEMRNLAVQTYHKAILEQSKQALEDIEMEQREFGALSFSIPSQKIKDLKKMLKNFKSEVHRWSLDTNKNDIADCVIQLNFQMFPQTRNK